MAIKTLKSAIWGATASILTTTVITIWGELNAPLKNWLASTFTHHWLGKSIISVAVFFGVWLVVHIVSRAPKSEDNNGVVWLLKFLAWIAILSATSLVVFYLYEFFK